MRIQLISYIALMLVVPTSVRAEINIEDSLEWICARADIIVRGSVVSSSGAAGGRGKNRDLISMIFKVREDLKGARGQKVLYVSARARDVTAFRRRVDKKDLLLFLRQTAQGYSLNGHAYDLWPLRRRGGELLLVNLAAPGKMMLSARGFRVLRKPKQILMACKATLRKFMVRSTKGGAKRGKRLSRRVLDLRYLGVPSATPVYRVLYEGSSCYLVVPGKLFPKARKTF